MDTIKDFLKHHQILPRISFKDKKTHTVKILNARQESFNNDKDELVEGVKFLVEEDGENKTFFTASQDLLLQLADCREGDVFKIKMYSKNIAGQVKNGYEVQAINPKTNDIPVIEDDREPTQEELDEVFGK